MAKRDSNRRGCKSPAVTTSRGSVIATALLAALLASAPAAAEPIAISASPVPLDSENPDRDRIGPLLYRGGLSLTSPDARFGGLSGLSIDADGTRLLAITDRALRLTARIELDADGRLAGLADADLAEIIGPSGAPPEPGEHLRDAEAIERLPDGRLLISFERRHRLWLYRADGDPTRDRPRRIKLPEALLKGAFNGGIEAAIGLDAKRQLLIAEDTRNEAGDFRAWIRAGRRFVPLGLIATGQFKPTDLARPPDGPIFLLERRFHPLGGAAARLSRIAPGDVVPGARLRTTEIVRLEPPLTVDNFEGLAVSRLADGTLRFWLLSDDNFSILQRTLLMLFELPPA